MSIEAVSAPKKSDTATVIMAVPETAVSVKERLWSLDFFRGFTMFLLIGESTLLYEHLRGPSAGPILNAIGTQLDHHPWAGLRFWDLVQPFFMFIVGVALAFSVAKREERGDDRRPAQESAAARDVM